MLVIAVVAIVAGLVTGIVGGAFRWILKRAADLQVTVSTWAHGVPGGWLVPIVAVAACAAVAAFIVTRAPRADGSGVQDVEAVFRDEIGPPPLTVVPARFVGGALSIGSGLVLGREGPTVHMGAALGAAGARAARLDADDARGVQTAMAGAGLAVAFNAPIGGALFVLEEVARSARPRVLLPTVLAVGVAVASSRLILGDQPDFAVHAPAPTAMWLLPLFAVFGVVMGVIGALYNATIVVLLELADRFRRVPAEVRAGVIGALIGTLLFVDPLMVGGGDAISQIILSGQTIAAPLLLLYVVLRFVAGPLSYAANTPGGLFAPLLALGALCGAAFAQVGHWLAPGLGADFTLTMALVGMSTLFAATVRAPLTGIALIVEMTAVTTATVPMLLAAGVAVVTTTLLRSRPIYDSLRDRMLRTLPPRRGDGPATAPPSPTGR